jgi:phage terminase large subunit-like protein
MSVLNPQSDTVQRRLAIAGAAAMRATALSGRVRREVTEELRGGPVSSLVDVALGDGTSTEVIDWIEEYLFVPEGKLVGQQVRLEDWQKEIIRGIYDTPTRMAIISMARKNGKTALAAMLLLAHLLGPKAITGSETFSAAQSRDQAALIYKYARKMVMRSPYLYGYVKMKEGTRVFEVPDIGTTYRALSADATTAFGLSPAFAIHDELGQVRGPTSDLFDAIETAVGAHSDPLSVVISTQSATDADLLSVLIDDAKAGGDPLTKLFLYTADPGDDVQSEETWRKANPALGTFRSIIDMRSMSAKAHRLPSFEASFRNLMLNQRTSSEAPILSKSVWQENAGAPDPAIFRTREVVGALDLSSVTDLTCFLLVATDEEGFRHVRPYFWTPADTVEERELRDRVPYSLWIKEGFLETTPGRALDYDTIAERIVEILEDVENFSVLRFDKWRMDRMKKALADKGGGHIPLKPFGQNYKEMTPAIEMLEGLALEGKIRHGMHPVLTNHIANATTERDAAGNRRLAKHRSSGRIDGAVTLVMGVASNSEEEKKPDTVSEGAFFFIGQRRAAEAGGTP